MAMDAQAAPMVLVGDLTGGTTAAAVTYTTTSAVGDLTGDVTGNLTGGVTGDVTGNLTGGVTGDVTGNLTGGVTGDVTGNLTGGVTGDVTGNLTGDVTGDVTGNLTGDVTGNLTGDVTGNLTGGVTGDVTGDVTGNVTGNLTGGTATVTSLDAGVGEIKTTGTIKTSGVIDGGWVKGSTVTDGSVMITGGVISGVDEMTVTKLTVTGEFSTANTTSSAINNTSTSGVTNIVDGNWSGEGQPETNYESIVSGSGFALDATSASMKAVDTGGSGSVALQSDSASIGVTNNLTNKFHGVTVETSKTTISGGTQATTLELDDAGARFSSILGAGGNARVAGVADGVDDNDAVNRKQLNTAYAGVASVAALAALPQPSPGRHFSLGVGTSYYQGESGVAVGMKGSITDVTQYSLGGSYNSAGEALVSGGIGMSW